MSLKHREAPGDHEPTRLVAVQCGAERQVRQAFHRPVASSLDGHLEQAGVLMLDTCPEASSMSATRTAFRDPAPAITGDVRAMLETLGLNSLGGVQDRALLLVVQLRRSTTDQEAEGRRVGLPFGPNPLTCPVRALRAWLDQAGIVEGPIFRPVDRHGNVGKRRLTDQSVALVVKRCARAAGLDPRQYAGHSLRAGLATAAAQADVPERAIMAQTGHPSLPMVHRYIRDGSLFRTNAAAAIGL